MALRHPFPDTVLPDFTRRDEPERSPPVPRRAREVKFRSGKDIEAVSKEIVGFSRVQLCAATGAGKSVRLPRQVSKDSGLPVIHVVPSRLLAVHLYDYLSTTEHAASFHLALTPSDPIAAQGVTLTYSANVMALTLIKGVAGAFSDTGGVVMFLDECHESDAYTYTLSKLAHLMGGVKTVIFSSATYEADRTPMSEPQGQLESRMFSSDDKPSTWDPLAEGKPWSVSNIRGNVLVYLDSETESKKLVGSFNKAGATAYRITAKMPVQAFRDACKAWHDPMGGVVVFVADYSMRSGFTFDVGDIIDSGIVQYYTVQDGAVKVRTRVIYQTEQYQTQNRGARTVGSKCVYWHAGFKPESALCCLEGVEMDAAAVMFRYLGYAVPAEISHAIMANGNVPAKFEFSANGAQPLSLLSSDMLVPLVMDVVVEEVSCDDFVEDVLKDYVEDRPVNDKVDYFTGIVAQSEEPALRITDGMTFLQQLSEMSGSNASLVRGRYYACAGLPNQDVVSSLYGEDWKLAMREIVNNPDLAAGFELKHKFELVAILLAQYNTALATESGIQQMLASQDSLHGIAVRFPNQVKEWSQYVGGCMRDVQSTCTQLIAVIDKLRCPGMQFTSMDPDLEMEKRIAKMYADRLLNAINLARSAIDSKGYLGYIESRVASVDDAKTDGYEKLHIDTALGRESVSVKITPCRVGSKKMQDLTVDADRSLGWQVDDYKAAVSCFLESLGLSVTSVRKLTLRGTNIKPDVVIQELRDGGDFAHRSSRWFDVNALRGSVKLGNTSRTKSVAGATGRKSIAYR